GWEIKRKSTMFPLVNSEHKERDILFGNYSIINTLKAFDYKVLIPENEAKFLNGGRNILQYSGEGIGAIQVECPIPVLKYDLEGAAIALANSIEIFRQGIL